VSHYLHFQTAAPPAHDDGKVTDENGDEIGNILDEVTNK